MPIGGPGPRAALLARFLRGALASVVLRAACFVRGSIRSHAHPVIGRMSEIGNATELGDDRHIFRMLVMNHMGLRSIWMGLRKMKNPGFS